VTVETMDPAWVAQERGTTVPALTEQLRHALAALARLYEQIAFAGAVAESGLTGFIHSRRGQ
jgi:hypothetical protein